MIPVYFIPGLGANCNCFKFIRLPEGYKKLYIEWFTPKGNETLEEYTRKMAENIDTSQPFILVGYSFGGVIVQEMNKFFSPEKTILIASMKNSQQIPLLFKVIKRIKFTSWFPMGFFSNKGVLSYAFARSIYFKTKQLRLKENIKLEVYMSQINPEYMKWSINSITQWKPTETYDNLYQIHGTKDPIFPYKKIKSCYNNADIKYLKTIEGANHILVLETPKKVNKALADILRN